MESCSAIVFMMSCRVGRVLSWICGSVVVHYGGFVVVEGGGGFQEGW